MTKVHCDWCGRIVQGPNMIQIDSDIMFDDKTPGRAELLAIVMEGEDKLDLCRWCKLTALERAVAAIKEESD